MSSSATASSATTAENSACSISRVTSQDGAIHAKFRLALGPGRGQLLLILERVGEPSVALRDVHSAVEIVGLARGERPRHGEGLSEGVGRLPGAGHLQVERAEVGPGAGDLFAPVVVAWVQGRQPFGQFEISPELVFGLGHLASLASDLADPEHALGMGKDPLAIVGRPRQEFGGGGGRRGERPRGLVEVATLYFDLAHEVDRGRPLLEGGRVEVCGILGRVVLQRLPRNAVHQVKPAAGRDALVQVVQHERHEALRLGALLFGVGALLHRFVPRHQGGGGQRRRDRHTGQGGAGDGGHLPLAPLSVAANQLVQSQAQNAGDQLEPRHSPSIAPARRSAASGLT